MLDKNTYPSTIGGIKRQAKQLKKSLKVPHYEALNLAAREASFENFSHARKLLKNTNTKNSAHRLFFTVYWYDGKRLNSGREVLEIELSRPLLEIATKRELSHSYALGQFRLASPDLFVDDHLSHSQEEAINKICKAVRVLRFMEATGLKPNDDGDNTYPEEDHINKLPNADHSTSWRDPDLGQFILIDEPYLSPTVEGKRAAWAKEHNWYLQASKWAGMYYPGYSSMFVATDASTGYDFISLMTKIDNIPPPVTIESWAGISSKGHDTFYSPLSVTHQDKKRAVAKSTIFREPSNKTQPMRSWGSPYNERRPNATMSIESHQRAARLIKAIQHSSAKASGVSKRLSLIKSKLEDWFFSEYDRSITDKFELFYYGSIDKSDPFLLRANSPKGVVSLLQELKGLLLETYVDCEPLRKMIGKLDTSIKFASKLL
ncbi:hypothetical protein JL49_20130 [Pseudoalteromonas luteoviolacea]|nr:hypothetical protein JL49_20130 [Pseudoalteromonas luteoviolacea]